MPKDIDTVYTSESALIQGVLQQIKTYLTSNRKIPVRVIRKTNLLITLLQLLSLLIDLFPFNLDFSFSHQSHSLSRAFLPRIYCRDLEAIQFLMELDPKVPQSPLSTHRSDSDSSSFHTRSPPRHTQPRFARSGSKSRSKSKEKHMQEVSGRFVKQSERLPSSPPPFNDPTHSRFLRMPITEQKREATPVKSLRKHQQPSSCIIQGTQRELQWVKLQRKCQLAEAENLKLLKINKSLQLQLGELKARVVTLEEQCKSYKQKAFPHQSQHKKERNNGLLKLRQEISKQKAMDSTPSTQNLKYLLQTTQKDMHILKQALMHSEALRKAAEQASSIHRSERQRFLQSLIQQLKEQASQRDSLLEKMKTQVNVLRVRLAKKEDEAENANNEELQAVKRKYGNVLKKYHEASQKLAAYRRKEQRVGNFWMERMQREDSLSLSP